MLGSNHGRQLLGGAAYGNFQKVSYGFSTNIIFAANIAYVIESRLNPRAFLHYVLLLLVIVITVFSSNRNRGF